MNRTDIWQAAYTAGVLLPKPVATCRYYHRSLNPRKLIDVGFSRLAVRGAGVRQRPGGCWHRHCGVGAGASHWVVDKLLGQRSDSTLTAWEPRYHWCSLFLVTLAELARITRQRP